MRNQLTPTTPSFLATLEAVIKQNHERAELLAVYRLRHRWKASDVAKLRKLKISPVAERRLAKLRGRSRPIIKTHLTPMAQFLQKSLLLMQTLDEQASPSVRLTAIKKTSWWHHYVEAVYRGEYKVIKAKGLRSASDATEDYIASSLGISSALVRKLCTQVRKLRREDPDAANFPAARLSDLIAWIQSGKRGSFLE